MKDYALVQMERKRYEEAIRYGLVMDFEEFIRKYVCDDPGGLKERLACLPCEPLIYVGDLYARGDDDMKGQVVVEYEVEGKPSVVSTMDDYLAGTKLRIGCDYDDVKGIGRYNLVIR